MVPNNCNQIIWYGTQKTLVVKYLPNDLVRGTKYLVTVTKLFFSAPAVICVLSEVESLNLN